MSIKVLIVDDSPFVCRLLTTHLQSADDIEVVGTALNGERALTLIRERQPDVITLDLEMPVMDGLTALQHIMHDHPTPVVMISGVSRQAALLTIEALKVGAVDFVLKYTPGTETDPQSLRREIIAKVRAAASIKVVRSIRSQVWEAMPQWSSLVPAGGGAAVSGNTAVFPDLHPNQSRVAQVVVIGASTGGPLAVRELLSALPPDFDAAVLVVQHIPASFTDVLVAQLNRHVPLLVKTAESGELLQPSTVYVAAGDQHLLLRSNATLQLSDGPKIKGYRPCIDVTMQSVAQTYGGRTVGVVLTGMGDDGSLGLVAIHAKGGRTFAQDGSSCVINGMPQRAIEKGIVDYVAPPRRIAELMQLERLL